MILIVKPLQPHLLSRLTPYCYCGQHRQLFMAQGHNWDSVIPIPWSSSSDSSSGSDTSSLLGDTMDKGYTWTSLLVANPDRPGSPRLILRRVPAPTSPSGSTSGSPTGDSDTSSLLGDTIEDIPWASLLAPLLRPIPLQEPVPPRGRDPEVSPSDPPPAPGKPKSLLKGPKPGWVQNLFRMMNQVGSHWRKRTAKPEGESSGRCPWKHSTASLLDSTHYDIFDPTKIMVHSGHADNSNLSLV
ncbi:hypothetical protein ABVT39_014353 [Epinephelus coioides]